MWCHPAIGFGSCRRTKVYSCRSLFVSRPCASDAVLGNAFSSNDTPALEADTVAGSREPRDRHKSPSMLQLAKVFLDGSENAPEQLVTCRTCQ